jgi:hypothetical protein
MPGISFALLRRLRWCCLASVAFGALAASSIWPAEPASHAIIAGFERFYADDSADAVHGGLLLLAELNCIACHAASGGLVDVPARQAPRLENLGG